MYYLSWYLSYSINILPIFSGVLFHIKYSGGSDIRTLQSTDYFFGNKFLYVISSHLSGISPSESGRSDLTKKHCLTINFASFKSTVKFHDTPINTQYFSSVWAPHTKKLKDKLENVQRRAALYVTHNYHNTNCVSNMQHHLNWPALDHRKKLHLNPRTTTM